MLIFTTDKPRLEQHFRKDPVLFAYHLGDLDDFYFPYCQWACVYRPTRAIIEEAVLIYTGGKVPSVLLFGLSDAFGRLMRQLVDLLPQNFHGHFQEPAREFLEKRYNFEGEGRFLKMKLVSKEALDGASFDKFPIRTLDQSDLGSLLSLYETAYPENYFVERMLATNRYYGIEDGGRLRAVAGVHVCSDEYNIAVLGNIATDSEYRGRGMSSAVTAHLTRQLAGEGKTICLNVSAENNAAISVYRKLGFEAIHEYREAFFSLK